MEPSQADAIARAFLLPDPQREAIRQRHARDAWKERETRKVAALTLVGFATGALLGNYFGQRFTETGLWGAMAGTALGWLWVGWRRRRHAG